MAREVVTLVAPHWPNKKVRATSVAIAESHCSLGAWHDNFPASTHKLFHLNDPVAALEEPFEHYEAARVDASPTSRDCGLFQINIDGGKIGSSLEASLRTESLDPAMYLPVAKANVRAAYKLWERRGWQPWVADNTGWTTYPEAWAYHHVDGVPVGPWVPSGRYLHQAIRAVANWHLLIAKDLGQTEALLEANRLANQYGITKGDLAYDERHAIYWIYPPAPTEPPTGPPWGYPVPNHGL
jgi:hypothetical protein